MGEAACMLKTAFASVYGNVPWHDIRAGAYGCGEQSGPPLPRERCVLAQDNAVLTGAVCMI